VVAVVRRQLGTRAVGHAGTLDPFATGLLVVLVGRATRLARFVEGMLKRYRAVVRFGVATDTDDPTGRTTHTMQPDAWPDGDRMRALASGFVGRQAQRPPPYSAKHVDGVRSHVLARRGAAVALAEVAIDVVGIDVADWSPPDLTLEATVGRGTYLRALARDLGDRSGIPAHCAALRRLSIGPFEARDAIAPADVTVAHLKPPAEMLPELGAETVDSGAMRELGFGRRVLQHVAREGNGALLAPDGRLLAVAEGRDGWWHPVVVLEPAV
jgi:tRNA pseudouridine55 synthase